MPRLLPLVRSLLPSLATLASPLCAWLCLRHSQSESTWALFVLLTSGWWALLQFAVGLGRFFVEYVWLPRHASLDFSAYRGDASNPNWAVVTGASDGIGRAFVEHLARGGMNVLLISRTPSKLQAVVDSLQQPGSGVPKHVQFDTVAVDFSSTDDAAVYGPIERALRNRIVSILINNVGSPTDRIGFFVDEDPKETDRLMRTNVVPGNKITSMVLKGMQERRNGLVIFDSSMAGLTEGTPFFCTYSGTKAYQRMFAHTLSHEMAQYGIQVQCLLPGPTFSNMTAHTITTEGRKSPVFLPASDVARYSLIRALYSDSSVESVDCVPCVTHKLLEYFGMVLPKALAVPFVIGQGKGMFNLSGSIQYSSKKD